jgi:hypothetical protein
MEEVVEQAKEDDLAGEAYLIFGIDLMGESETVEQFVGQEGVELLLGDFRW